jgi:hypothetical protein
MSQWSECKSKSVRTEPHLSCYAIAGVRGRRLRSGEPVAFLEVSTTDEAVGHRISKAAWNRTIFERAVRALSKR